MSASNPQGKSSVAFKKAAIAFDVHESDFLGLLSDNVNTYESMRVPFPRKGGFRAVP